MSTPNFIKLNMHFLLETLGFFLIFIQVSLEDKPYNFRPESRLIPINEGETFYIGFSEIQNKTQFTHCHIKSNMITFDYPICRHQECSKKHQINPYKGFVPFSSICAFIYSTENNKIPVNWTITAYDNITNESYPENVRVSLYYNMPTYLDRMVALQTSTVVNFFFAESTKLKKCLLSFQNVTVELDMNLRKVYNLNNVFKSRLNSLGEGKCGYKINNLSSSDPSHLTLLATDVNNKVYRNTSLLVVIKEQKLQNRTQEVYLGDTTTVKCGKQSDGSANSDQKFCYLYNPRGDLVFHGHMCAYNLDIVTLEDLGVWKCSVGYDYIMESLEFTTKLVEKRPESITSFYKNATNYYMIGCQLVNFNHYSLRYCKFTRPDGKIFKVTTGGATANYNTFSTDLNRGRCSLEIVKPLRLEDKGTWKCEAAFYGDETSGAFITVEKPLSFSYQKNKTKNVRLGNSFVVDCMVPFSSDHCYIVAPNGTQYRPENRLQITTGVCMFKVESSTNTDNGTWQCSIARRNGIPDEIIKIEVSIIDLKMLFSNVEATEDSEVVLSCNTNGIPIDYCRFVSPVGLSYSLRKQNVTFNGISYSGRGLQYGDCGIKISKVNLTHSGSWSCHISSGRYNYKNKIDLSKKIQLVVIPTVSPFAIVAMLGIAIGSVTVLALGTFFLYKYLRRGQCCKKTQVTSHYSDRTSNGSNDSNETAVLAVSANALYTTYRRQAYTVDE